MQFELIESLVSRPLYIRGAGPDETNIDVWVTMARLNEPNVIDWYSEK